jgi:hypothetical protein
MLVSSVSMPMFNIPGKGFVLWSGHEYWAYAVYRDNPKAAAFIIGTKDLVKAILMIEKAWE